MSTIKLWITQKRMDYAYAPRGLLRKSVCSISFYAILSIHSTCSGGTMQEIIAHYDVYIHICLVILVAFVIYKINTEK